MQLHHRWSRFVASIAPDGDSESVWRVLHTRYTEPFRAYHNLLHIEDCLRVFDEHHGIATNAQAVEAAIWFHDVIYTVGATDNEARSAAFAAEQLAWLGADGALVEHVAGLIQATDHRTSPAAPDARLICDIDLSILGRAPDEYDAYAAAIRREVGVREAVFGSHRVVFLRGMLAKPQIFHTRAFAALLEQKARKNMQDELIRLEDAE